MTNPPIVTRVCINICLNTLKEKSAHGKPGATHLLYFYVYFLHILLVNSPAVPVGVDQII